MNCIENLRQIITSAQALERSVLEEFLSVFYEKEIRKGQYLIETGQTISKASFVCSGIFRSIVI